MAVPVEIVLWDFGDTLVDETWMHRAPDECPDWPNAWAEVMSTHADDWNVGRVSEHDVLRALGARANLTRAAIEQHVESCCGSIRFHPLAWRIATERRRPQALVTVNPDLFVERVARAYHLERHFDAVVVSCLEGTADKVRLCEIALDRLGFDDSRRTALLIDNRRDLTEAWAHTGGAAYWYRGDEAFEADVPTLLGSRI
jgi:FMN phosphatase YigB (HAD superfamily)